MNYNFKPEQLLKIKYLNGFPTPTKIKGIFITQDDFFITVKNLKDELKHIPKNQILDIQEVCEQPPKLKTCEVQC